jgi:hypothetical protein
LCCIRPVLQFKLNPQSGNILNQSLFCASTFQFEVQFPNSNFKLTSCSIRLLYWLFTKEIPFNNMLYIKIIIKIILQIYLIHIHFTLTFIQGHSAVSLGTLLGGLSPLSLRVSTAESIPSLLVAQL